MAQVTKDTMIGELLQMDFNIAQILFECGMHCPGCPSARFETLEEAAMVHGFDCALLVEKINAYLKAKEDYESIRKDLRKNGKLESLGEFCHEYVKNELVSAKKELLLSSGISYSEFCEKYSGKDKITLPSELSRKAKRSIIAANRIKPVHLSPDMLLSVGHNSGERRILHKAPEKKRFISTLHALVPTTVTSFFAVSIVCSVIKEPSSAVFIECLIKLFTLIWNGSKGFLMGYNNIAIDTTAYLSDCTDILTRFSGYTEAKP